MAAYFYFHVDQPWWLRSGHGTLLFVQIEPWWLGSDQGTFMIVLEYWGLVFGSFIILWGYWGLVRVSIVAGSGRGNKLACGGS